MSILLSLIFFYFVLNLQQLFTSKFIAFINIIQIIIFYIMLKLNNTIMHTYVKIILHILSVFVSLFVIFNFNSISYIIAYIIYSIFELFSSDVYDKHFIYWCIIANISLNLIKLYYDTYQIGLHFFYIQFLDILLIILFVKNIFQLNTKINNLRKFKTTIKFLVCLFLIILYFIILA
jgi:hypothetical protein